MGRLLSLFCPDQCAASLADLDAAALKASGFDTIMLDLDNTLLPWKSAEVPDSSRHWIEGAKQLGMKLCIISNTHYPKRLNKIASDLGICSVCRALKPRKSAFAKAARMIGSEPERTVVVGDQILTDILGGNLAGMRTILVKPMHRREFVGTKVSRLIERGILALLRRKGRLGTNSEPIQSEKQDTR